jgi:hypothetical protein
LKLTHSNQITKITKTQEIFGNIIKTVTLKEDDKLVMGIVKDNIKKMCQKSSTEMPNNYSVLELHVNVKYRVYHWETGMVVDYEVNFFLKVFVLKIVKQIIYIFYSLSRVCRVILVELKL